MEVIIFSKIVGVICSLAMVLSGRSQTSVNPEPTHNEDGIASELRAEIGGSFGKNSVNSGKMTVEKDGSSTTSHDSEPSSKCSSHDLGPETPHSENNPASDVYIQIDVLESVSNNGNVSSDFSQSDISESDEEYSSEDESWSSSDSEEFFSGDEDEGRALAELNEGCGYPRDCEEGLSRSEVISLRRYNSAKKP